VNGAEQAFGCVLAAFGVAKGNGRAPIANCTADCTVPGIFRRDDETEYRELQKEVAVLESEEEELAEGRVGAGLCVLGILFRARRTVDLRTEIGVGE
jgi:hypothetical protein